MNNDNPHNRPRIRANHVQVEYIGKVTKMNTRQLEALLRAVAKQVGRGEVPYLHVELCFMCSPAVSEDVMAAAMPAGVKASARGMY